MPVQGDNSLFFTTGLDNSGLAKGSLQAQGIISSLGNKISKINPFAALGVAAVAAMAGISREAYKLAKDFEHAMREVETISDATQANFKGISSQVFELSKVSVDGPVELAKAYYQIVSAGHDGAAGLKLLEVASKAAVGGVTDTKTAADGLTTILNAWGIEAERVSEVSDVLFTTVKLGKTTFEELSNSISIVAPLAAATGVGLNEVTGAVATLTKQGTPTTVAMTQIRQAMIALTENLGDAWAETYTFQEALGILVDKAGGSQNELKKLVGRIEGVNAVLALTGENAAIAASDLQAMSDSAGASEKAFRTLVNDTENQWKILSNRIKGLTKELGESVLIASEGLVRFFNNVLEGESKASKAIKNEQTELYKLQLAIVEANDKEGERIKLIDELKRKYPNLLENLLNEESSNEDVAAAIRKVNEQLIDKIRLQTRADEIEAAADKAARLADKADAKKSLLQEEIITKEKLYGIEVDANATTLERAAKVQQKLNSLIKDGRDVVASSRAGDFTSTVSSYKTLTGEVEKAKAKVQELTQDRDSFALSLGIDLKATDVSEVSEEAKKVISQIKKVTLDEFKANQNIFDPFLKSTDKAIKEAAEGIKKTLSFALNSGGDDGTQLEKFQDNLNLRKAQYNELYRAIKSGEQELAEKLKTQYGLNEEYYSDYLRNLYEQTKSAQEKSLILSALEEDGAELQGRKPAEVVSEVVPEQVLIPVKFTFEEGSIDELEIELKILEDAFEAAAPDERERLRKFIDAKREEIKVAKDGAKKEGDLYKDLTRSLSDLTRRQVLDYIDYWKERLREAKKGSDKEAEILGKIASGEKELADKTQETFQSVSGSLSGVADLFSEFGDDETAKRLEQLAGVAEGAADIAKGIATGNPVDIIKGGVQVIKSAVTVEVDSDTEKFEKAIEALEKTIDDLDYVIGKSFGQNETKSRVEQIDNLIDKQRELNGAIDEEKNARKKVKVIGITVSKKGKGSGTDLKKVEEFEQKAKDAAREVEKLQNEIHELLTGSTRSTVADELIKGFREGKMAAEDFTQTFEGLMRNALLESFKLKYLKGASEKFFKDFASAADSNQDGVSDLNASEIASLRASFAGIVERSEQELAALNEILGQAGISGSVFGEEDQRKEGLSGGIKTITEDTANILAGTINSIRIDIKTGLDIAQQSSEYLSAIANNTTYNKHLETMDENIVLMNTRLGNIEDALS